MKRVVVLLVGLCLVLSCSLMILTGCSSSNSDKPKYSDEDFIKSMGKALESRWALNDKYADQDTTIEHMKEYIQVELDELTPYGSATFKDTKLQQKALQYINALKESMDNVEGAINGSDKWNEIYDERSTLIMDFAKNYGLTVSDKYQAILDEFISQGSSVEKKASQDKLMKKLVKKLKFKQTKNDYGYKEYQAILENTTDYEIKSLSLDVNLLDKDGVNISTQYAYADNVKPGQKARLEFSTDEEFDKIEVTLDYYELEE